MSALSASARLKSAPVAIDRYGAMQCLVCGARVQLTAYLHPKDLPSFDRDLRRFRAAHQHEGEDHGRAA